MHKKTILTTERLVLRTWSESDIPKMALISADPQVMQYFPALQTLQETEALIRKSQQQYHDYGYSLYAVALKETAEFIGFVGLNHVGFHIPHFVPQSLPSVEIGWRLSANHWGQGYATEAASAVLHDAFNRLHLKEVISFTAAINLPSRRVMEKIGLTHNAADDFDHPKLSATSPLRQHVLYRESRLKAEK